MEPRPRGVRASAAASSPQAADSSEVLQARTVKFFADGVIEMGTGFLVEPYNDAPHTCGLPNWSPEELAEAVTAFDADGFQIHIHAIGDGGVRMALDAIEAAARAQRRARPPAGDRAHTARAARRPVAVRVARSDRELRAAVGVPRPDDGGAHDPAARPRAIRVAVPDRDHRERRCTHQLRQRLAGVVDASSARPRGRGDAAEPGREAERGWLPEERLPIAQALAAYTAGTAYQGFEDDTGGVIVVGSVPISARSRPTSARSPGTRSPTSR